MKHGFIYFRYFKHFQLAECLKNCKQMKHGFI